MRVYVILDEEVRGDDPELAASRRIGASFEQRPDRLFQRLRRGSAGLRRNSSRTSPAHVTGTAPSRMSVFVPAEGLLVLYPIVCSRAV